ncbi:MAG: hypothetical protein NC548_05985 [Lachnospiraceae bacterium]|nr:hypothetical protein [Lachnospiraceae bacterium]
MNARTHKKGNAANAKRRPAKIKVSPAAPQGTEASEMSNYSSTQEFLNSKMIPQLDPKEMEKLAQEAVAKGEPDPRPPQFTYIDDEGNIVRVTTATGEKEIIGKKGDTGITIDDTDGDGKIIHLPNGNDITLTMDQWHSLHALLSRFAYGCDDAGHEEIAEPDIDDVREYAQSVKPQLTELSDAMPNDCVFEEETGSELNPEYIAIDSIGDFWMISGNCIFPVTIDNGIARFPGDNYYMMYGSSENASFAQMMAYWNWAMLKHDAPGRVLVDYQKVPTRTTTAKDLRIQRQANKYRAIRGLQQIVDSVQNAVLFITDHIMD